MDRKNAWKTYTAEELKKLETVNEDYKNCLDEGKTERECIRLTIERIEKAGYRNIEEWIKSGKKVESGDKIYAVCMNKTIAMFHIGERPLEEGMNILGAHIDSPRIDVKQNPLYENEELAYLDTHYYGGIKKYQWVTLPLALHGVIVKKDGTVVPVKIGEKEDDPVFVITDLLIHLAAKQMEKKAATVVEGEKLDLLIGSRPIEEAEDLDKKEKEAVKANVLELLKKYYDEHGNTDISDDLTVSKASIKTWISRQKKYAKEGRLSEEQIEKLKAIGLLSDISYHEHIWNERYSLAKQYYEEYGNISVPQNAVYHEFQLGIWIYKQRVQKREGVLSQDRIELLAKLGIEWNNLSEIENASLYEKGFQHLEKFISEKGIYKIRAITVCDDGYRLGNWISNCRVRYRRGELAKKYVERFRRLRFPLDAKDEWEYRYEELKAYFEKNDTKRLPEKYTAYDGTDLSLWFARQKRAYKKGELTKEQMKKFDDIGYPFKAEKSGIYKANMTKWLAKYEIVKEYLELHKGEKLDPKAEYKGIKIIDWIRQQRNFIQNGVFSDERVEMFNELDPKTVLDSLISHWDIMYEEAVRYFDEHGVGASVKKGIIVDGSELCNWVNGEQKIVNGKDSTSRTPEQIEKLKKIGIEPQVNDRFEKQWLTRYEELRSFIAENGRMPLTRKIKGSENSIAVWLNSQKKKYKNGQMSDKHIEMLEALKVDLDPEKICR